jgi:ferredoxin-thioredoxin reductase catalytic chain
LTAEDAGKVDSALLLEQLKQDAEAGGYHINPDATFASELAHGIATNIERYGYPLCPCRLTGGSKEADLDIICPCDYRDPDLDEFDTCY